MEGWPCATVARSCGSSQAEEIGLVSEVLSRRSMKPILSVSARRPRRPALTVEVGEASKGVHMENHSRPSSHCVPLLGFSTNTPIRLLWPALMNSPKGFEPANLALHRVPVRCRPILSLKRTDHSLFGACLSRSKVECKPMLGKLHAYVDFTAQLGRRRAPRRSGHSSYRSPHRSSRPSARGVGGEDDGVRGVAQLRCRGYGLPRVRRVCGELPTVRQPRMTFTKLGPKGQP